MNAASLSKALSAQFLANGNYDAVGGVGIPGRQPSAAALDAVDQWLGAEDGFSGLAVQSVGYTKGAAEEDVVIYVTKGSRKALKEIPSELDGVKIRTEVMGKPKATPAPANALQRNGNLFELNGRVACGSSCGPSGQDYAGTLGALATNGQETYALSNNHVFAACNHTAVGMPILSPATIDARPGRRSPGEVCQHSTIVELRSGFHGLVSPMGLDAACGIVAQPDPVTSWQGEGNGSFDTPTTVSQPVSGMKVKKFGRTTGLTLGTVEAFVATPWALSYKSKKFSADVWFQNTWTVRSEDAEPFALPGDSGSLIVTEDGSAAVGLLFAVNNRGEYGIFCPIEDVLRALGNLTLISGHGT